MYILAGEIMTVSLHHFTFSETDCQNFFNQSQQFNILKTISLNYIITTLFCYFVIKT